MLIGAGYAKSTLDAVVASLTQAGATDARLSHVKTARVPSGKALDGTLTFTAANGQHNYWRIRTIVSGRTAVQIQVVNFGDPGDTDSAEKADGLFDRLTSSLVLG